MIFFIAYRIRNLVDKAEREFRVHDFCSMFEHEEDAYRCKSRSFKRGTKLARRLARILGRHHLLIPFNAMIKEYAPFVPMEPVRELGGEKIHKEEALIREYFPMVPVEPWHEYKRGGTLSFMGSMGEENKEMAETKKNN